MGQSVCDIQFNYKMSVSYRWGLNENRSPDYLLNLSLISTILSSWKFQSLLDTQIHLTSILMCLLCVPVIISTTRVFKFYILLWPYLIHHMTCRVYFLWPRLWNSIFLLSWGELLESKNSRDFLLFNFLAEQLVCVHTIWLNDRILLVCIISSELLFIFVFVFF